MVGQNAQVKFSYTQVWNVMQLDGLIAISTEPILAEGAQIKAPTLSKEERHTVLYRYDGETIVLKIISKAKKAWIEEEGNEYTTELKVFIRNKNGSITTIDTKLNDYILQIAINKVTTNEVILIGLKGSYKVDLLDAVFKKTLEAEKISEDTVIPIGTRYWLVTNVFKPTWFAIVHKALLHNLPKTVLYREFVTPFSHEYYEHGRLKKFSIDGNELIVTIKYKGETRIEKYTLALF